MPFEQAQIPVQKTEQFEQLRGVIDRSFASGNTEKVLRRIQSSGARIREFEKVLEKGIFEAVDPTLNTSSRSARQLYSELTLSDQALMREFYLERIEQVNPEIRRKFQKVYQYY